MRIVVIGAGVVGITTAWYLAKDGHEVSVLEARDGVALETSFGNAGGVCPGFAGPWAAPGMPFKALKWMFSPAAPLKIRPAFSLAQWTWLMRFVMNCTAERYTVNKTRMQKVAHYSKAQLKLLREETGIQYDHGTGGVLQLFQTKDEVEGGRRNAQVLSSLGIPHRLLSAAEACEVEVGLAGSQVPIMGGLQLIDDETGDCHLFCRELEKLCRGVGVSFSFGARVTGLQTDGGRVSTIEVTHGQGGEGEATKREIEADAIVLATGPQMELLHALGLNVPVYPVKGYSMTTEIKNEAAAPRSSVMDEHSKVMITRLGNRIRAAGVAELAGFNSSMPEAVLRGINERVKALFPDAADYDDVQWWHGFRPMTADGPSQVSRSRYENLYLNIGHGSSGWTQACGTGKMMADLIADRPFDVALS
ncbi:D-amino acid dehydrogenase [Granulosicoccus antarcticus]|uniref:D-amino acid dehydrogenase n=1 Tax=Granulosicoccus antarcticus IMCC3135 TaxID=1192854 RepID=A0A2Z2P6M5_9GAMM|nr:D-amino acid dehydrogenase [Granulosicoccus antarcticus]ASJ76347.1 D-amino acid dehydrogenase [Granulosicoccus antarcticus IMCC3135]